VQQTTGAPCLFWQGASGDVNPILPEAGYEAARTLGMRLGCEAAKLWHYAQPVQADCVKAARRLVNLPPYHGLSQAHATRKAAEMAAELEVIKSNPASTTELIDWYKAQVERTARNRDSWTNPALTPPAVPTEQQAFRLGELAWAGVPTEIFSSIGMQIKKNSPYPHTFIATHANDYFGYLPAPDAYPEGGYEVDESCAVAPEGITLLVDNFTAMFQEIR